jgi:photosystem II stability/assembly factor-like uncharacterized protein
MGGARLAGTIGAALLLAAVVAVPQTDPAPPGKGMPRARTAHVTAFPNSAQIVSTQLITLPSVSVPPSAQPDANQADVFFRDRLTGFLANGGGPGYGTDQGGAYSTGVGGIDRTTDGGASWHMVWSRSGASIYKIGFAGSSWGWAAGWQYPTAADGTNTGSPLWLESSDGGRSWSAFTPAVPDLGQWWNWSALQFTFENPSLGLGVIDPDVQAGPLDPVLVRTRDGGRSWQLVTLHGWRPTGGIAFSAPDRAFATGYVWPVGDGVNPPAGIWTSYDSGLSWWRVIALNQPFRLDAVDFPDPLHGYAAGGNLEKYEQRPWRVLLATVDGGRTWSVRYQSPYDDRTNQLTRLDFVDAAHGWSVVGGCSEGQNGPCTGQVMATSDGGQTWRMTAQGAYRLAALSSTEAWAVTGGPGGPSGILVHTVDGGAHWTADVQPWAFGINSLAVAGPNMLAQTLVGNGLSQDGGRTWQSFSPPLLAGRPLLDVGTPAAVAAPPNLLITQDPRGQSGLAVSHDGGLTWTSVTLPSDPNSFGFQLAAADSAHVFAIVGNQQCLTGSGPIQSNGKPAPVPQGMANVFASLDGGLTWTPEQALPVYVNALSAAPGLVAFTGGDGGCQRPARNILGLSRDGRHWTEQALPASCDSITVAAPSTIWLRCSDAQGYLLVTLDGGRTWTKLVTASASMAFPATVVASGPSEAWAYGPAWSLWHTTDAGLTWSAQALPATLG